MLFKDLLLEESKKEYFINLMKFVDEEYESHTCFPPKDKIFEVLNHKDIKDIKVVILGQDPYYLPNQAMGLAFSVNPGIKLPKSLINIYKELYDDLGITRLTGDLSSWADEGVCLLNTILTVRKDEPLSHQNKGWEIFTDRIIEELNKDNNPKVFLLWGKPAQMKKSLINNPNHLIIETPHPSPLSSYRGFFGSKIFSRTNDYLISKGLEPIDWS